VISPADLRLVTVLAHAVRWTTRDSAAYLYSAQAAAPLRHPLLANRCYRALCAPGQCMLAMRSPCSWAASTASLRLLTPSLV
jgi:hypothetical protein